MSAEVFLDTNIFIYDLEALDERKAAVAEQTIRTALLSGEGCISFQVVQECLNTILCKSEIPLTPKQVRAYLDTVLAPLYQVPPTLALYHRCLDVQNRYRYSFYDSLIIAAALEAGYSRLITEDMRHGQRIEGLRIENPFEQGL